MTRLRDTPSKSDDLSFMSLCRLSEEALKERVGEALLEIFGKDQETRLKEVDAVLKEIMKQEKKEKQQSAQQN